jgi:hypothetical protein
MIPKQFVTFSVGEVNKFVEFQKNLWTVRNENIQCL